MRLSRVGLSIISNFADRYRCLKFPSSGVLASRGIYITFPTAAKHIQ